MAFVLSISGNTVGSETHRLRELFGWYTQALEVGGLQSIVELQAVAENCRSYGIRLGLQTPVYAIDDALGLLWGHEPAWHEIQRNLEMARDYGFEYIVVAFPYLWDSKGNHLGINQVRETIPRLKRLERCYGVPIVCQPKLGPRKDPSAFTLLWSVSKQELLQWDLSLCLGVGDLYLASQVLRCSYDDLVSHLAPWCQVVHLHHVRSVGKRHYRTPVEEKGNVPILRTLELLGGKCSDIFAVAEHTPHRVRDERQVAEGLNWLLGNSGPWKGREGITPTFDGKYKEVR